MTREPKQKRGTIIAASSLLILGGAGLSCGVLFDLAASLRLACFILLLIGCGLYLDAIRCPYCKRYLLRPRPFWKNAGHCPKCGKPVEYARKKPRP